MRALGELFLGLLVALGFGLVMAIVIPAWLAGLVVILALIVVANIIAGPNPAQQQITSREGPDDWV